MRIRKILMVVVAGLTLFAGLPIGPASADLRGVYVSVMRAPGAENRLVIDLPVPFQGDGVRPELWPLTGGDTQYWAIVRTGTTSDFAGIYELRNYGSNRCLDMAVDGPIGNGTRVQQWRCSGGRNQRWVARPQVTGDPWVKLVNLQGNLCLDAVGASYHAGTKLQVWQCSGNWNQRFNIS
ncbi:RICIN domain-containing protein [Herbidospora yilanensis]|uniref:RICIN domain-containing protein n=1 Tax=Herbidospora yilanensis TaxID=354426 RepID=UPI0007858596|nr:RICIN domain-containing protein [Herbidospora yilanensis]